MEGIIGFIIFVFFAFVIFGGVKILSEKYLGVRIHGKFGALNAYSKGEKEKERLEQILKIDPESVQRATERCKKKKIKLTYGNVLSEIDKEDPLTTLHLKRDNITAEQIAEYEINKILSSTDLPKTPSPPITIAGDAKKIDLAVKMCMINDLEPTEKNIREQLKKIR